jgi:CRP/FNR family transcriptional regulator, anaerobic regulatory protein
LGQCIDSLDGKNWRESVLAADAGAHDRHLSQPPLACADCGLGRFAIYGPTKNLRADEIYIRRRSVMTLPAGKIVLREGETARHIHTLYSGWAFSFKQTPDGRRQILSFLIPGDSLILESLCFPGHRLPYSVKTLTSIAACSFDLPDMAALTRATEEQSHVLANALRDHMSSLHHKLFDIGCRSALGRLSRLLLELEEQLRKRRMSANGTFQFPARQEHLADALGLTTVYVNRTLDKLRRQEIIHYDCNRMSILDFDTLREFAELE